MMLETFDGPYGLTAVLRGCGWAIYPTSLKDEYPLHAVDTTLRIALAVAHPADRDHLLSAQHSFIEMWRFRPRDSVAADAIRHHTAALARAGKLGPATVDDKRLRRWREWWPDADWPRAVADA